MSTTSDTANESPHIRFCALEYQAQGEANAGSRTASVILLVLRDEEGDLRFLVHPELRNIVQEEDSTYVESLLRDFLVRAELHPDALFEQISSLSVGPLVTHEAGSDLSNHPQLGQLCSKFVQL